MKKYRGLSALSVATWTFAVATAARADILTPGGVFKKEFPVESKIQNLLTVGALVCLLVALAFVGLGSMRRRRIQEKANKEDMGKK